jgi:hypothetical protein
LQNIPINKLGIVVHTYEVGGSQSKASSLNEKHKTLPEKQLKVRKGWGCSSNDGLHNETMSQKKKNNNNKTIWPFKL